MSQMLLQSQIVPPQIGPNELEKMHRDQRRRLRLQEATTGWVGFSLAGFVFSFGAGFRVPAVRKERSAEVKLRGVVGFSGTIAAGGTICTMPAGMWPTQTEILMAIVNQVSVRADVNTNGTITFPNTGVANGGFASFADMSWFAD
jgi:hypothetical protein